jgi:hypothetical protein
MTTRYYIAPSLSLPKESELSLPALGIVFMIYTYLETFIFQTTLVFRNLFLSVDVFNQNIMNFLIPQQVCNVAQLLSLS